MLHYQDLEEMSSSGLYRKHLLSRTDNLTIYRVEQPHQQRSSEPDESVKNDLPNSNKGCVLLMINYKNHTQQRHINHTF